MQITASLRSVNGLFPGSNGNLSLSLGGEVYTGTDALRQASTGSEGSIWIVSGDSDGNKNGTSFAYDSGSGWLALSAASLGSTDARYLMLTPQAPLSGSLNMGGFNITNGNLVGTASVAERAISSSTALFANQAATASYVLNAVTASYVLNAVSASHAVLANSAVNALSASHAVMANQAATASYFLTSSVTSASFASTAAVALNFLTSSVTSASFSSTAAVALNFLTSSVTSASFAQTAAVALSFLTSSVTSASVAVSASYAVTSSHALVANTAVNTISASVAANLNGTGSIGFVSNIGDTFTSVATVTRMISLTAAEYAALATKDANTFYAVV
jgi:hypothetical protein